MILQFAYTNFFNPPILFFFLGMIATFLKVDLNIPNPLPKFIALYLLIAIGFEGGVQLSMAGLNFYTLVILVACIGSSIIVSLYSFFILRYGVDTYNAAAIAASYGSVSAVTFITATTLLKAISIPFSGTMVAALALMESPAIIVGLYLVQKYAAENNGEQNSMLREAFLNNSVFLLLGSMLIGFIAEPSTRITLQPFLHDIFKGMLCLFLLDMGLLTARRMADIKKNGIFLCSFALLMPLVNACVAIIIGSCINLHHGDLLLFTVLSASASYIAVPAALRMAIPQANPSLYLSMALGITFPFNILIGLPLYLHLITFLKG
ncbi:MAG: sodium-dependent bicarbonate transport family permease [Candidatus Babeliales bacterium]